MLVIRLIMTYDYILRTNTPNAIAKGEGMAYFDKKPL